MPQMGPLMWTYLYMTFSLMILISMVKIYFHYDNHHINSKKNFFFQKSLFNWKW